MSFQQELSSWFAPKLSHPLPAVPRPGDPAPQTELMPFDAPSDPTIIVFIRHCGCPFSEKTFLNLRQVARSHKNISFLAISHSSSSATKTWLNSLPQAGSEPSNLRVLVDARSEAYAAWGLGPSSYAHVVSPWALYDVWKLGSEEGIWNRPTESGSRWQTSGWFGVDGGGIVRWGGAAVRASEIPNLEEGVEVLIREDGG